ncbi:MAG: three-Cys-motif partner protein TcmP [Acidobacteria bacterium]|nr:three-Cys-motif partner protein TcmP [Acidobacteriota bacterium]
MPQRTDPHPAYWDDYTPFQHVKHDLIRCYLNGWYPKLGFWAGRVLYVDTHAGRGKYETGDPGSPLVALQTLLAHGSRDRLLSKSEFNFLFIERSSDNVSALKKELHALGSLPARIRVDTTEADAFDTLSAILSDLRKDHARMAPAFLFIDPFGFKVPASLLADLMRAGRVELFVNVMWRELDMLIRQQPAPDTGASQTLDEVFGSSLWRTDIRGTTPSERIAEAIRVLGMGIKALWTTPVVRMVTGGTATRYLLVHFTNSDNGRDLMKSCRWSLFPDGDFRVRSTRNPDQPMLFEPEANMAPVREWVIAMLKERPMRWKELHDAVRAEDWLETHVNEVMKQLKKEGRIAADTVPGRSEARSFTIVANPVLRLTS